MPLSSAPIESRSDPTEGATQLESEWCQAVDPTTGVFYYYNEQQQVTQWEPPQEGYLAAHHHHHHHQQQYDDDTPFIEGEDGAAVPMEEGVEMNGDDFISSSDDDEKEARKKKKKVMKSGGVSPYAEAVASYKQMHGWWPSSLIPEETVSIREAEDDAEILEVVQVVEELDTSREAAEQVVVVESQSMVELPRMESTGLMPRISAPDPTQHITFNVSDDDGDAMETREEEEEEEVGVVEPTTEAAAKEMGGIQAPQKKNTKKKKKKKKKGGGGGGGDGGKGRKRRMSKGSILSAELAGVAPHLHKYWLQRYSLFSRYDYGVGIDDEAWYSSTPEVIAWHQAKRIKAVLPSKGSSFVVDAFGGVGGNSIQLALAGCHVLSVEIDSRKASLLQQNARVYDVSERVEVVCVDFLDLAPRIRADVVLLSPPWGGPEYSQEESFDVEKMGGHPELGLSALLKIAFEVMGCQAAVAWLPRSASLAQVQAAAAVVPSAYGRGRCEVEFAQLNGRMKAMTVYYGTAARYR